MSRRTGTTLIIEGPVVRVPLRGALASALGWPEAIIDADLPPAILDQIARTGWNLVKVSPYARAGYVRASDSSRIYLHKQVLGLPFYHGPLRVDHIDNNTLDCRLRNLRLVAHRVNCANRFRRRLGLTTTPYTGVNKVQDARGWETKISIRGRTVYIGSFSSPELASEAYAAACAGLGDAIPGWQPLAALTDSQRAKVLSRVVRALRQSEARVLADTVSV